MSERSSKLPIVALIGFLILLAALTWGAFTMSDQIRDLQRRVGQLESERRR